MNRQPPSDSARKAVDLFASMQAGAAVAREAADPYAARVLGRHVLVATGTFLEAGRQTRKGLARAGVDARRLQRALGVLDQHYRRQLDTRDTLGAHRRANPLTDTWRNGNGITRSALDGLVSAARGAVEQLALLSGVPAPIDTGAEEARTAAALLPGTPQGVHFSADVLGLTRAGTIGMLAVHPLHERASAVVGIREALGIAFALDRAWQQMPDGASRTGVRWLAASALVTDVVNLVQTLLPQPDASARADTDFLELASLAGLDTTPLRLAGARVDAAEITPWKGVRDSVVAHAGSTVSAVDAERRLLGVHGAAVADAVRLLLNGFDAVCRQHGLLILHTLRDTASRYAVGVEDVGLVVPFDDRAGHD